MIIEFYRKNVYGNEHLYPMDYKYSEALYEMTGKTTLTQGIINGLKVLGFTFKEVLAPKKS